MSNDPQHPVVVVAFLGAQSLGDFVCYHMCSASVARAFPNSRLVVVYRDDRPYKNFITALNPFVTDVLKMPADAEQGLPLDWFDDGFDKSHLAGAVEWLAEGPIRPDVFLVPYMMDADTYRDWGSPVKLRVPSEDEPSLSKALASRGVDPDRWFVVLHMRENYRLRKDLDKARSVDPSTYMPMIERIIENQGGQVVRIGDPAMTPLPRMPGLFDLGGEENSFPLQAFAISRGRYFVGTDSGPQSLAGAFKVPTAITNAVGFCAWNDGDVILPRKVILANGDVPDPGTVMEVAVATHHFGMLSGPRYDVNTPEQLCAVADHMFETTGDCPGWRPDGPEPEVERLGYVTLPLPWKDISRSAAVNIWGATEKRHGGKQTARRTRALDQLEKVCAETGASPGEYIYEHRASILRDREEETRNVRRIVALFGATDIGNFVLENMIAAYIARRFPGAYFLAGFRDNSEFQNLVVDCNRIVDASMAFPGDSPATILVDWFDNGILAPVKGPPEWQERRLTRSDLVLLPDMLRLDAAHLDGFGEAPPVLRLPAGQDAALRGELMKCGLDPGRWFACLHMHEDETGEDGRAVDSSTYLPLITRLIDAAGGQVVRIGVSDSSSLPPKDGLVDLTQVVDSFSLQGAAIQFARFFLGTDSGYLTLASAFKVPTAGTNMIGYAKRLWNRGDVVLAKSIRMPDGSIRRSAEADRHGYLDQPLIPGARYLDNDPHELIEVADHMLRKTTNCKGWRSPSNEAKPMVSGPFRIPLPMRNDTLLRFWG